MLTFPLTPCPHGWCGVCLRSASPGEYGHCEDGFPPPEGDEVVTVAKPSRHWGFCSHLCQQEQARAHKLKVKEGFLLNILECAEEAQWMNGLTVALYFLNHPANNCAYDTEEQSTYKIILNH